MTTRVVEVVVLVGRVVGDGDEIRVVDRRDVDELTAPVAGSERTVLPPAGTVVGVSSPLPAPGAPATESSSSSSSPDPSSESKSMVSRSPSPGGVAAVCIFLPPWLNVFAVDLVEVSPAGSDCTPSSSSSVSCPSRSLERAAAESSASSASGPAGSSASEPGAPLSTELDEEKTSPRWTASTTSTLSRMMAMKPQS